MQSRRRRGIARGRDDHRGISRRQQPGLLSHYANRGLGHLLSRSQPSPEDLIDRDYDDVGHIDIELVKRLVPDTNRDFYLCGPTPFMKSLFDGLLEWEVPEHRIHYEFFGPASALKERAKVSTPKRLAEASECCTDIEVTFSESGVRANWNPSFESILDLAEANGLSPDYSCRSGICHTRLLPSSPGSAPTQSSRKRLAGRAPLEVMFRPTLLARHLDNQQRRKSK